MDLLLSLFSWIFIFVIVTIPFYIHYKKPIWKGKYSEALINHKLFGLSDDYIVFKDLWFSNYGHSTQIDHLVVSPYGVFVIETKGYKGWILGGEYSEKWTQNIYGRKYEFYNPIRQNEGHVRFLRRLLKYSVDIPFIPIVVFNNDAKIKVHIREHLVVNRKHIRSSIKRYKDVVLSDETIKWITQSILANVIPAEKEIVRKHKENIKRRKNQVKQSISNGVCPICGGKLVLRRGKYGRFYGCSNYPQCRFVSGKRKNHSWLNLKIEECWHWLCNI